MGLVSHWKLESRGGPGGSFLFLLGVVKRVATRAAPTQRDREMKIIDRESMEMGNWVLCLPLVEVWFVELMSLRCVEFYSSFRCVQWVIQ